MQKPKQTPGSALSELIKKNKLNYNRLAKAIGISSAMVRLIARDENPVSASVAFRFAKFFKNKPEFWLSLQLDFAISQAAKDKKLAKEINDIPTVDTAIFERKRKTSKPAVKKTAKPGKRGRPAKIAKPQKPAVKKPATKKPAAKKPAVKKTTVGKRGRPAKVTVAKAAAKAPVKKPVAAVKRNKPAVKPQAPAPNPVPVMLPETIINEPQI